jgi:hypothetical protein
MLQARAAAARAFQASRNKLAQRQQVQHRTAPTYEPGALVYCYRRQVPTGGSVKLARFYVGPYRVEGVLKGERAYVCVHLSNGRDSGAPRGQL